MGEEAWFTQRDIPTLDSAALSSFRAGESASVMAAWGRLLPDDKDSYTWAVLPSKFSRKILDVATSTSPSCWEESSSLQTMVRGIGIELDILGIQCNVLSKSFNNTWFYVDYFWLQNSCSRASHLREKWKLSSWLLDNCLKPYLCKCVRMIGLKKSYYFDDNHHHLIASSHIRPESG